MTPADVRKLAAKHHDRTVDDFIAIVKMEYQKREWEWVESKLNRLFDEVMVRRKRFFEAMSHETEAAK